MKRILCVNPGQSFTLLVNHVSNTYFWTVRLSLSHRNSDIPTARSPQQHASHVTSAISNQSVTLLTKHVSNTSQIKRATYQTEGSLLLMIIWSNWTTARMTFTLRDGIIWTWRCGCLCRIGTLTFRRQDRRSSMLPMSRLQFLVNPLHF